jgi:DNA helicase-2/ATP-dependent DNA helicase PcrA
LAEAIERVVQETGYDRWLGDSPAEEDQERLANIAELVTAAREFDERHPGDHPLETFLEQASLVNDTDDWKQTGQSVSLMTLHAAKGLEFAVVYVVAIEQGLLPHERCREDPAQLEEERRLLFVGITRCREQLQLSFADTRPGRGRTGSAIPSPFLMELPRAEMEVVQLAAQRQPVSDEAYQPECGVEWQVSQVGDEGEAILRPRRRTAPRSVELARVMTAAELLGRTGREPGTVSPDEYRQGMVVTHPKHGPGKILELSGSGNRRTATVQFFNEPQPIRYVLRYSELQVITASDS